MNLSGRIRATSEVTAAPVIGTGKPLLMRVRYLYNDYGELVDFLTGLYNPDLFSYKIEAKLKKPEFADLREFRSEIQETSNDIQS